MSHYDCGTLKRTRVGVARNHAKVGQLCVGDSLDQFSLLSLVESRMPWGAA